MVLAQTEQNHQADKARGSKANIPVPCRRRRRRAGVWRTEPLGPTKRRRTPLDTRKSPLWSTREQRRTRCRRVCVPKYHQKKRKDPNMVKGSKDEEESTSRTMDSRSGPSELLKVCAPEHVAGCRCEKTPCLRHLTSSKPEATCSGIQFEQGEEGEIGARKEGNVHVLD